MSVLLLFFLHSIHHFFSTRLIEISFPLSNRERDTTLRALSLTSKKAKELYLSCLWENLTFSVLDLLPIYHSIQRGSVNGSSIKSITLIQTGKRKTRQGAWDEILDCSLLVLPDSMAKALKAKNPFFGFEDGTRRAFSKLLSELDNLQSLSIEDPRSPFQILPVYGAPLNRFPFLITSLKRISIIPPLFFKGVGSALSGRNVIWLLIFCPCLEAASLGFTCSNKEDFNYLTEFQSTFKGVSKVRELALVPLFYWNQEDKKTWWGSSREKHNRMRENKKMKTIEALLTVTNQLYSLELNCTIVQTRAGDNTYIDATCLNSDSLCKSLKTLKHLRIFGLGIELGPIDFSALKNLESLSFDRCFLWSLSRMSSHILHRDFKLPPSLSILALNYYTVADSEDHTPYYSQEENSLSLLLDNHRFLFPNLKEVVVPESQISGSGVVKTEGMELWEKFKEELERNDLFTGGKVKLTKARVGDVGKLLSGLLTIQKRSKWENLKGFVSCTSIVYLAHLSLYFSFILAVGHTLKENPISSLDWLC